MKSKKIVCPICACDKTRTAFKAGAYTYYNCGDCAAVFLKKILFNKKYLSENYNSEYYNRRFKWFGTLETLIANLSNYLKQKLILKNLNKKNKINILDIGCGDCTFLFSLSNKVFNKHGIDLFLPRKVSKGEIKLYEGNVFNENFSNKKFDVITLLHVIEHMKDPHKIISKVNGLLKKNGVFVVSTPSTNSLGFIFGNKNWFHLDAPKHVVLFNQRNIRLLLQKNGFEILAQKYFIFEFPLDLLKSVTGLRRLVILFIYPVIRVFDRETQILVCRKV